MEDDHDALCLSVARAAQRSRAPARLVAAAGGLDRDRLLDPACCEAAGWRACDARALIDAARSEREAAGHWRSAGWIPVAFGDAAYPSLLRTIEAPPPVLFIRGDPGLLSGAQIALVGTRNPSADGRANARSLARGLAARGFTVTSGLALGIDGEAHAGALETGTTVAVMGSGPDRIYPARHRGLANRVAENGALVTEFPPGAPPRAHHFPRRNRIISGLSLATLIVEAAPRSGSLITARLAAEQGREVLAVPGSINNPRSRGCHDLLRDGAWLVAQPDDVQSALAPMRWLARAVEPDDEVGKAVVAEDPVLAAFTGGVNSMDDLHERTGLEPTRLRERLTELEIAGCIERLPGGYQRVPGEE